MPATNVAGIFVSAELSRNWERVLPPGIAVTCKGEFALADVRDYW
jgi:hypothetical protein